MLKAFPLMLEESSSGATRTTRYRTALGGAALDPDDADGDVHPRAIAPIAKLAASRY